jgi:hypothetical protein
MYIGLLSRERLSTLIVDRMPAVRSLGLAVSHIVSSHIVSSHIMESATRDRNDGRKGSDNFDCCSGCDGCVGYDGFDGCDGRLGFFWKWCLFVYFFKTKLERGVTPVTIFLFR